MSNLQYLAKQKTDAELERQVSAMSELIEAMLHEHAAKGLLKSGATLKRVVAICKDATEKQRDAAIREYRWAVNQALAVSQSWVERLVFDACVSIDSLHVASEKQIKNICKENEKPELVACLLSELAITESASKNDIALALRSCFAERSRGLIKSIPGFLQNIISKIFSGGATR